MHRPLRVLLLCLLPMLAIGEQAVPPPPGPERSLNLPKISEKTLPNGMLVVVASFPSIS